MCVYIYIYTYISTYLLARLRARPSRPRARRLDAAAVDMMYKKGELKVKYKLN